MIYKKFLKIKFIKKKMSIKSLDSDRLVCMIYSGPMLAILTDEQLSEEKRMYANFQINISKTEGLVRVNTDQRTGGETNMALSTQHVTLIYI